MQLEGKRMAKAKLQPTCNSFFANYLDDVLVWNYAMSGFKRGIEKAGMGSVPACICVLNSLKFRLSLKNHPREWRVG
jgi:hypothetical protein